MSTLRILGTALVLAFGSQPIQSARAAEWRTVEQAMSQAINWWGDLPPPMKEAIEQFRTQLGAAIDSVEFVKRALDRQVHETDRGKGPA
jgi:hypothetical protein